MHAETTLEMEQGAYAPWNEDTSAGRELERAKEELELAAYVISHDLKAPLRAIMAAHESLSAIPALAAHPDASPALEKIARESERMKTLMQGTLDYLNLETYAPARSMQDSNEIVATALGILEGRIQEAGVKVSCDALPEVYGHRARLSRLFMNLLDNAIKFRSTTIPAVRITAQVKDGVAVFCVEDNGIGIDEEYHAIVFQLFQRLHRQEEYPGEGIGLALSRKIVESHGGKIWVESVPGRGSRFRFTLPAAKPQEA